MHEDTDSQVLYKELLKWKYADKGPEAVLLLTGGSPDFLRSETISSRLKSSLNKLVTTTRKQL